VPLAGQGPGRHASFCYLSSQVSAFHVEARPFRPGDEELLLAGLERAVRAAGGGARRELFELRWRYAEAPHGACVALALDGHGRPTAGVFATRHRVRFEGREAFWLEVGDVFNDFAHGAGLVRARALLAAGKAFAETFGGPAPEKHPVMYGTPDRRTHRLGLRHLEWEVLRSENELVLEPGQASPPGGTGVEVEEVQRFPDEVEHAFSGYAEERAAILARDAAYLNWRYAERPRARFDLAIARRGGEIVGYAVQEGGQLHDWCVRPEDEHGVAALLGWAHERAQGAALRAVIPDSVPEWLLFQHLGFRVRGTREYLCFRSFQRPAIMSWLFQHWTYSRGDTLR
jgi:hypothetical protein